MLKSFTELNVWKKAHQLVLQIYKITDSFPAHERFGLSNQMRRAAVSIPSNIAEGFKKASRKDSVHFYNIAEGSLEELRYQVILSHDLRYITGSAFSTLSLQIEEVSKMLNGWKKSQIA